MNAVSEVTEDELRQHIARGRRITRDPGLLVIIDELERLLNERPVLKLRGNHVPDTSDDAKIKKSQFMKFYMRDYRKGIRRTKPREQT
jgi:hypothetical protein